MLLSDYNVVFKNVEIWLLETRVNCECFYYFQLYIWNI